MLDLWKKYVKILQENPSICYTITPDGAIREGCLGMEYIMPGTFNPLHEGHREVFSFIETEKGKDKAFEFSIRRWGKPDFSVEEICKIINQFSWYANLIITNAPTFLEKSRVLSGYGFFSPQDKQDEEDLTYSPKVYHIGYDTAQRIVDTYGIVGTEGLRCIFHVHNRIVDGHDCSVYNWKECPVNFVAVERDRKYHHMSSTQIRAAKQI